MAAAAISPSSQTCDATAKCTRAKAATTHHQTMTSSATPTHISPIHSPNISKRGVYTSMHCAGLVMNDIIFLDILAHHGFYTKRYPREGILLFTSIATSYLIPQTFFFCFRDFVFGTGTGPGDPQRIDLHCLIILDCRSTWRLQGREREWNWERELEMWSLNSRVAFFDNFERPAGDG